jgi:hypothetical protein
MRSMTEWVLGMDVVGESACFNVTPQKLGLYVLCRIYATYNYTIMSSLNFYAA